MPSSLLLTVNINGTRPEPIRVWATVREVWLYCGKCQHNYLRTNAKHQCVGAEAVNRG